MNPSLPPAPISSPQMPSPISTDSARGIVYCLINAAMPRYVKIGLTGGNLADRMRQLDTTGVPLPFECVYAVEVPDAAAAERLLHEVFGDVRVRPTREFFEIGQQRVVAAMRLTGGREVTPATDIIEDEGSRIALDRARTRRSNFNFEMVRLGPGSVLEFSENPAITCTVVDAKTVNFEGETISLSAAALRAIRRRAQPGSYYQRPNASVQGAAYWEFEGESIDERRRRLDEEA